MAAEVSLSDPTTEPVESWAAIRQATGSLGERVWDHATQIADVLQARLPEYAGLTVAELTPGVSASISAGMSALGERRGPLPAELERVREVAETRAHQGVPLSAMISAYQVGAEEIWRQVRETAGGLGAPTTILLEAAELLWHWTDAVTTEAAEAHQRAGMQLVRHDQQKRTDFLRALLFGSVSSTELRAQAGAYRLVTDRPYRAFQAEFSADLDLYTAEKLVAAGGSLPGQPALVGLIEGGLAGVVARVPELPAPQLTIGLGPAVPLSEAGKSYQLAGRALTAAWGFGLVGAFPFDALSLQIAVATDHEVGEQLVGRYLQSLPTLRGLAAEIEDSLRVFLRAGMRVETAARELFIHPNTLRHRLRRFEAATHCDLSNIEDLFGIWWALERRSFDARGRRGTHRGSLSTSVGRAPAAAARHQVTPDEILT